MNYKEYRALLKNRHGICERKISYSISPTGEVSRIDVTETLGKPCASPIDFNRKVRRDMMSQQSVTHK